MDRESRHTLAKYRSYWMKANHKLSKNTEGRVCVECVKTACSRSVSLVHVFFQLMLKAWSAYKNQRVKNQRASKGGVTFDNKNYMKQMYLPRACIKAFKKVSVAVN